MIGKRGDQEVDENPSSNIETAAADRAPSSNEDTKPETELPAEDAQRGVQDAEAVTLTWSKGTLITVFILYGQKLTKDASYSMFLLYFVNGMQSNILYNLIPFVTSDFELHSLLTVIYIVANAISGAVYIPLAKVLDLWGRAEGFLFMLILAELGLILMAACNGLSMFCAAYTFYSVGFGGMTYCIDVITADASKLKNRALAYAFTSSPYIITAFAGPKAADEFYTNLSWRWGFGTFAIILPFVATPLFVIFKINLHKAGKRGIIPPRTSQRTLVEGIVHYADEFDIVGVFLFAAGMVIFLLPFSLADSAPKGWATGYIIAMIVLGFILLVVFGVYESLWARKPFLNAALIANRTVFAACLLNVTYMISYYCWNSYYTSFLQVVNDLSIETAGYVASTFDVVSGLLLLGVGFVIRKTGYFKWLLYIAVPLYTFGQGLMIYFRKPNTNIGYLVMCQIFISIGGCIFISVEQLAILAASDHQHVAAVLALLYVVGTIGASIGNTISATIWTNTFETALVRYLPESALPDLVTIYSDLETQLSYPWDSPTRIGIQKAYGYAQERMLATGTAFMIFGFIAMFLIKNINVKKIQQTKGTVF
ncbi:hypothetical protein DV738_g3683, partial [Chaetothyriales sp. CBS 135597]